jgi:hypothetical protein
MEDASQAHEVADRESCVAPSFMTADREGYSADQPSEGGSGQEEVGDKSYVVLRNGGGILAVYRIRNDGMRAAPRPEPVRDAEEVFLVDRVQQRDHRPLDDLVLKGRDRERALPAIRLGDVDPP